MPVAGAAAFLFLAAACTHDVADREYLAALRGEEEGMSRQEQIARLDWAIEQRPDRARYFETRAIYKIDLERFNGALADLDAAIELADRPYLRFLRGLVLCRMEQFDDAIADFDAAIGAQPENTQFYRGRALAYVEAGEVEEALADAERLVETAPQLAESHYAMGKSLAAAGRHREAAAAYDEAVALRSELVYPLWARAESRRRLGDPGGAEADETAAAALADERKSCRVCLDPFRY